MRMYDVIMKKRGGGKLSPEEIAFWVDGVTDGSIPEYQTAALLMAIYFRGMDEEETALLTHRMAHSGDVVDLSPIPGVKVDKHSTGGVGDKTSLVLGPIVASCGVPVAKMSGRGLGHTGGTIDKMEAIPGMLTTLEKERFFEIVRETGVAIIGQSGNIAPADKKLYALRDVTATVDNLSLIAASIMSKKLAAGSDAILLDVKTGSGAFMKTLEDSIRLAESMVSIGVRNGKRMAALITEMDVPLGRAVGNSLEIAEVVETLRGKGPGDLTEICLTLAANMLCLAEKGTLEECRAMAGEALSSGRAFQKLKEMTAAQGGDTAVLDNPALFEKAPVEYAVPAPRSGFVTHVHTETCGMASVALGAGRVKKEDSIDYSAGIVLLRKTGDPVEKGEALATLHTSTPGAAKEAEAMLLEAYSFGDAPPAPVPLIHARVTPRGVEKLSFAAFP